MPVRTSPISWKSFYPNGLSKTECLNVYTFKIVSLKKDLKRLRRGKRAGPVAEKHRMRDPIKIAENVRQQCVEQFVTDSPGQGTGKRVVPLRPACWPARRDYLQSRSL
jgi:hypothetical protein